MAHTLIKFEIDDDGNFLSNGEPTTETMEIENRNKWHILRPWGQNEYTVCGNAIPEYDHKEKVVARGGITCSECLEIIKSYKAVRL